MGRHHITRMQRLENGIKITIPGNIPVGTPLTELPGYDSLKQTVSKNSLTQSFYSGQLDSMITALDYFRSNLPGQDKARNFLAQVRSDLNTLYDHMNTSGQVNVLLLDRLAQLELLPNTLFAKRVFRRYQKQVFKYQGRVAVFQDMLEHPDKSAALILTDVQELPGFASFFAKNARLGQLFSLPDPSATNDPEEVHPSLQTRAALSQAFKDKYGRTANLNAELQRNLPTSASVNNFSGMKNVPTLLNPSDRQAQTLSSMKNQPGTGSGNLRQRFVPGINFQHTAARLFFPATSDIGLQLGYKINQRGLIGIGGSYKLGLGRSWDNIRLTHEGLSLRTFMDFQLKGNLYISGGYEQHYRRLIGTVAALKDHSAWQASALIGLSKQYRLGSTKGHMQLLWDIRATRQVPKTQPLVWRIGYTF